MLLIKPYLGCNLACKYCYEGTYRKKNKPKMDYDLGAIFKRMEEFKDLDMALHGGEPLTLPKKDVEAILAKMYELLGRSSIQTNATLIDNDYIKMFKKYKTSVGISWDGPDELSAYRPGSTKVKSIIERLIKEGVTPSFIIVVSKSNAGTKQQLNKLKDWLLYLAQHKISGRINPCYNTPGYELGAERLNEVYLDLADFCLHNNLRWSPFTDIINGLKGKDRVCTFMGCDPFCTQSATVILGDGSVTNCMRTNKKDILLRHPAYYKTRNEILENVDQKYRGCKDCKYWTACYGGCPSSALDDDWRNRTHACSLWKTLFQFYEDILSHCDIPVVLSGSKQQPVEQGPCHGDHADEGLKVGHGDAPHGDHSDAGHGDAAHGDLTHGDIPHGDIPLHKDLAYGDIPHGDHSDAGHGDAAHGDLAYGDIPHGDSG